MVKYAGRWHRLYSQQGVTFPHFIVSGGERLTVTGVCPFSRVGRFGNHAGNPKGNPMNISEWREECVYISETTDSALAGTDSLKNYNGNPSCFVRYCEMQRDTATREGFHDVAQYIDHCIDDMAARGWSNSSHDKVTA